uniref:F-box protein At3g26010-like beta-propeller domain-containing protein n=1 Tax=Davidia involucrata TaxID=16924 RepID=A0A5B6YMX7_DAVIN
MQWVALPLPPTCPQKVRIGFICKSSYSDDEETNFSSTTHFTVVRILQFDDPPPPGRLSRFSSTLKLEMFSSETGKWTQSVTKSKSRSMRFVWCELHAPASAVVCNGILHWCDLWAASADSIFAHDPSSNTDYRIIKLPKDKNWGTHIHCFGECQEHLMFAKFCGGIFKVWQLKDYNRGEWSLLHAVHLTIDPQIFKYATCSDPDMYILAFHPTDRDVLFLGFPGYIILCNLRSTTLKAVCCLVHPNAYLLSSMVFPFVLPWWPTPVPPLPSPE